MTGSRLRAGGEGRKVVAPAGSATFQPAPALASRATSSADTENAPDGQFLTRDDRDVKTRLRQGRNGLRALGFGPADLRTDRSRR